MNYLDTFIRIISQLEMYIKNSISVIVEQFTLLMNTAVVLLIQLQFQLENIYDGIAVQYLRLLIHNITFSKTLIDQNRFEITSALIIIESALLSFIILYISMLFLQKQKRIILLRYSYEIGKKIKHGISRKGFSELIAFTNKQYTLLNYRILIKVWTYLEVISLFNDPFSVRNSIIKNAKIFYQRNSILREFPVFFLLPEKRKKAESDLTLHILDKTKKQITYNAIPQELIHEFIQKTPVDDVTALPQWVEITETLNSRFNEKLVTVQLVMGISGAGKTTFLNYLYSKLKHLETHIVHCSRHENLEKHPLIGEILQNMKTYSERRMIVLVDDIELIFEKRIGGYTQFNTFLQLINKTKHRIIWVISMNTFFLRIYQLHISFKICISIHLRLFRPG
jgi:hypothetical protein